MWIAACCLAYEAPLATLNLKDYVDRLVGRLAYQRALERTKPG